MEFKRIKLVASEEESFVNELKFEVATARTEGVHVLRIDIIERDGDNRLPKFYSYLSKALRSMKQKGIIQFFAFPDNFERHSTESVFLLNKYPEYVDPVYEGENEKFLFIKL